MEEIVYQTLLFDFYGELLTPHQQKIYEAVICNDMGYSEVAAQEGVSRQGIHELIRRSSRQLNEYEQALHLVEKFLHIRELAEDIRKQALEAKSGQGELEPDKLMHLADDILKEL